jgi:hypothetical protein
VKEKCFWMHLEGFRVVSRHFWALAIPKWSSACGGGHRSDRCESRPMQMLCISLTGAMDRFDQSEPSWYNYSILWRGLHAFVQGELHWFRGSSLWFSSFGFVVFFSLLVLGFFLCCVEPSVTDLG